MTPATHAPPFRALSPVTSTDALKALALALILVDHIGHFLADDWPILRVIGRLGVPIFFFLIGFAKTRDVPNRWLVIGAVLTAIDFLWVGSLAGTQINILFNFALIRLALPLIARHALQPGWRMMVFAVLLILAMPLVNPLLEYGTEGWLFALMGLLRRRMLDDPEEQERWLAPMIGFLAAATYLVVEIRDYAFQGLNIALLFAGVFILKELLARFRRLDLPSQPGPGIAQIIRLCGRYSLEIYAAQIILLAALGGLWSILDRQDGEDDD